MSFNEQYTPSDPFEHFRGAGSMPVTSINPPVSIQRLTTSSGHLFMGSTPGSYQDQLPLTVSRSDECKIYQLNSS